MTPQQRPHRAPAPARSLTLLCCAGLALGACSGGGKGPSSNQPVSTGLNTLLDGSEGPAGAPVTAAETADETERRLALMEQALANSRISIDGAMDSPAQRPQPRPQLPDPPVLDHEPIFDQIEIAAAEPAPPPTPTEAERLASATSEISALLIGRADRAHTPAPDLLALAALEYAVLTASGSGTPSAAGELVLPPQALRSESRLTPRERDALTAWRTFLGASREAAERGVDPATLEGPARAFAESLRAWGSLSVPVVALCARVDGFGAYTELPRRGGGHRFLAGSGQKMIVYTEVDHFAHTSTSHDETWGHEVRLTQRLDLFHAAGSADTLVWKRDEQPINDFSRHKRRDFFVVQVVELPPTLGVGSYRLKVTMTDKATGAVAETLVPFEVVAHTSALR